MEIEGLTLQRIRDLAESAVTVAAAHHTGVLEALGRDPAAPPDLARRSGLDRRALEIVLPALEELGLLRREEDGRYAPTDSCRRTLCDPDHPEYAGGGLDLWLHNLRGFTELPDVLRTGRPLEREGGRERDEEGLRRFMAAMAAAPEERVRRIVRACLRRSRDDGPPLRVLDLGGGPGHMARGFVDAGCHVTMMDTPETVAFVRDTYGLAAVDDLALAPGDFHEDPLPQGPFDVVLLSNVVHIYGPERNRALMRKVADVTAPDGVAAVMDFVRERSPRAARFALVMLLRTESGDTYTFDALRAWMEEAGFGDVRMEDVEPGGERQLVSGIRRG